MALWSDAECPSTKTGPDRVINCEPLQLLQVLQCVVFTDLLSVNPE